MPNDLDTRLINAARYNPFLWTLNNVVLPDATWDFTERRWQLEILKDPWPRIASKKSAQVGETVTFICKMLWFLDYHTGRAIWTFPRQDDVTEFVPTRFHPLLSKSPNLSQHVGRDRDDPRSMRITKYRDSYIYFQEASVEPRQTPADLLANDEVDRSNPEYLDAFVGRLEQSNYKIHYRFSTPTIPNFGIDKIFNEETDQRYWMVKCPACNHRQSLKWDVNLMLDQDNRPYYGCEKCRRVLTPEAIINGEYVAMHPGRNVHGYHVSGMMLPLSKPPAYMYQRYQTMDSVKNFYNVLLGETYETSGLRYDAKLILDNVFDPDAEPYSQARSAPGGTYMGVDQKGSLHVVIGQQAHNNATGKDIIRLIHAEEIPHREGVDSWARLGKLMDAYNVRFCVCDGVPNQHPAWAFQEAYRGKVALAYHPGERSELYTYNEDTGELIFSRNANLDGLLDDIKQGLWRFWGTRSPLDPVLNEILVHCGNLKRDEEERKGRDGSVKSVGVWRHTGPDDFVHAWSYVRLAAMIRPANRMQVTLIGEAAEVEEQREKVEFVESKVWPGLLVPKHKGKKHREPRIG